MIKKFIFILLFFLFFMIISPFSCLSSPITIDGDFTDWTDKPGIYGEEASELPVVPPLDAPSLPDETDRAPATPLTETPTTPLTETPTAPNDEAPLHETVFPDIVPEDPLLAEDQADTDTQDNGGGRTNYHINQLKWSMGDNSDVLYIMLRISHPQNNPHTRITTEIITDFGDFIITTTYDVDDGSVMTKIEGQDIESTEGLCQVMNKNTLSLEFGIPITSLIEDMQWGYQLQFRVSTVDDTQPKKGYIIVSTASTMPYLGVLLSAGLCIGILYLRKRKKTS